VHHDVQRAVAKARQHSSFVGVLVLPQGLRLVGLGGQNEVVKKRIRLACALQQNLSVHASQTLHLGLGVNLLNAAQQASRHIISASRRAAHAVARQAGIDIARHHIGRVVPGVGRAAGANGGDRRQQQALHHLGRQALRLHKLADAAALQFIALAGPGQFAAQAQRTPHDAPRARCGQVLRPDIRI
jgi:hypothetical protein